MGDTKLWETRSKWQRRSVIDVKNNEKEGKDLLPNVDLFFVHFCVCFAGGVKKEIGHIDIQAITKRVQINQTKVKVKQMHKIIFSVNRFK